MAITEEQQKTIDNLTNKYAEKLRKRIENGKDLAAPRKGRLPSDVPKENADEYVVLRIQLTQLKRQRQESAARLRELREKMDALRKTE